MEVADALESALRSIHPHRVHHPQLGVQERVLCYELYCQLRIFEMVGMVSFEPARLQAELNKTTQRHFRKVFQEVYAALPNVDPRLIPEPIPDLLIHRPGDNSDNRAVIEVKREGASHDDMEWDLAKLALFTQGELEYQERFFIIFSENGGIPANPADALPRRRGSNRVSIVALLVDVHGRSVSRDEITYPVDAAHNRLVEIARKKAEEHERRRAVRRSR